MNIEKRILPRRAFLGHITCAATGAFYTMMLPSRAAASLGQVICGGQQLMLDQVTKSVFDSHVGSQFTIHLETGDTINVELMETKNLGSSVSPDADANNREGFSLLFRGTKANPYLPQQIYKMQHPELGQLDIFLVPIGPEEQGTVMLYEAVFN